MLRRRLRGIFISLGLLVLLLYLLLLVRPDSSPPPAVLQHPYFRYDLDGEEPRSFGQKCVLPRLHPFHPSVWKHLSQAGPILCRHRGWIFSYVTSTGELKLNASEIIRSRYKLGESLFCYWSVVTRAGVNQTDDDHVSYGTEVPLTGEDVSLPPGEDVFQVRCQNLVGVTVYERVHARVRKTVVRDATTPLKNPLNVLVFGLDSMSRLAFIRLLPRTYRYLTEELKMTVFRGTTKVGDNTFPNLVAVLTGRKAYGGGLSDTSEGFDEWPLLWRDYSSAGYATLWAEDFPQFGLFNYLAEGFRAPPTDHYLRPFWLAVAESNLLKFSSHLCYGETPKHLLQMSYVREFVTRYRSADRPFFGFSFLAEISHEYLSRVASADGDLEAFFRDLERGGDLRNTLLVVMSDHGHRFDAIRTTEVGHAEERMPFLAVRLPDIARQPEVEKILTVNRARLVTPFDLHETLLDFLKFVVDGHPMGSANSSTSAEGAAGQSLFSEISPDRTCTDASIPADFCACETELPLPASDERATAAARATIEHLNRLLHGGGAEIAGACAPLLLERVRSAHLVDTMEGQRVRVVLEASPGGGLFEATVAVTVPDAEVVAEVSRINPYAGQSDCIRHVLLRKYCFCQDLASLGSRPYEVKPS